MIKAIQIRSAAWQMSSSSENKHWPFFKRTLIHNAHPTKLILKTVGAIWGVYFLWDLKWELALAVILGSSILGSILVWGADEKELAETYLGRLVLSHLHPVTMAFHVFGSIVLIIGIMSHSTPWILSGISLYFIGHIWGWQKSEVVRESLR